MQLVNADVKRETDPTASKVFILSTDKMLPP